MGSVKRANKRCRQRMRAVARADAWNHWAQEHPRAALKELTYLIIYGASPLTLLRQMERER